MPIMLSSIILPNCQFAKPLLLCAEKLSWGHAGLSETLLDVLYTTVTQMAIPTHENAIEPKGNIFKIKSNMKV
jgi:hypothetical protein